MIFNCSRKMMDIYKIKCPEECDIRIKADAINIKNLEKDDDIYNWGCKSFYLDGRKCILVCHFSSRFSLFLVDIKMKDVPLIPNLIAEYLLKLYESDETMVIALKRYFSSSKNTIYDKLTDKNVISALNRITFEWDDGKRLLSYLKENVLQTLKANYDLNFKSLRTVNVGDKKEYRYPSEVFKEEILKRFE